MDDQILERFRKITKNGDWKKISSELLQSSDFSSDFIVAFHTYWTEAGHRIREQVEDDNRVTLVLRKILPSYDGEDIVLYRGENKGRFLSGTIGFCWTTKMGEAKMFASGLNSIDSGGVILRCACRKEWVISAPSKHSLYLGEYEYTLEPSLLLNIEVVEEFPASPCLQ